MSISVTCHECECLIELDERPINGKITCPICQTLLSVNQEGDGAMNVGRTYSLTAVNHCPKCKAEMPPDAKICINCGYNFQTGKQTVKVVRVKEFYRSWTFGFVPIYFSSLKIQRTTKGGRLVTVTARVAGIPFYAIGVDLRKCQEVWIEFHEGFGVVEWIIMAVLLLCGVFPGLFWWKLFFTKPNYTLRLPYRDTNVTLYKGWNENKMRHIIETLGELKHLEVVRK